MGREAGTSFENSHQQQEQLPDNRQALSNPEAGDICLVLIVGQVLL